jgi:hypothetical protein
MAFKDQINLIKNNWFVILVIVFLLIIGSGIVTNYSSFAIFNNRDYVANSLDYGGSVSVYQDAKSYNSQESFAPEIDSRLITKTSNLSLNLKKGQFLDVDAKIKNVISNTNSFLLNENSNISNKNTNLKSGQYTIKVPTDKLNFFLDQLKTFGEVTNFRSNSTDITGEYNDITIELASEKNKLQRYKDLYNSESANIENKINLIDQISYQERRIKYLEDSLENKDTKIEYSTIYLNISESSSYINIIFVKFSDLLRTIVGSINILLQIIFAVIPFLIVIWLVSLLIKLFKTKKKLKK